jgi:Arc/MetJ family transcription regulator
MAWQRQAASPSKHAACLLPEKPIHIYDMGFHMKTTLNIDDTVMAELKREAARQGRTMSDLVETALRLLLSSSCDGHGAHRRRRGGRDTALHAWERSTQKLPADNL